MHEEVEHHGLRVVIKVEHESNDVESHGAFLEIDIDVHLDEARTRTEVKLNVVHKIVKCAAACLDLLRTAVLSSLCLRRFLLLYVDELTNGNRYTWTY